MMLEVLVALSGGGILAAVLTYLASCRQNARLDFQVILAAIKEENGILREQNRELLARVEHLERQVNELTEALRAAHE